MEEIMLLNDYMNNEVDKNLQFTFKTYKKSIKRYVTTSVNQMSFGSPRLRSFLSRNGSNHYVVFDVLDGDILEIYIKTI